MSYRKEFPDFPESDMPAIPEGFKDVSWHNDAMPSFTNPDLRLSIWIDYADPEKREFPEMERFSLHTVNEDGFIENEAPHVHTDDWNTILHKISDIREELNRQVMAHEISEERKEA